MSPHRHIKADNALFSGDAPLPQNAKKHGKRNGNLYWQSTMQPKELTKDYQNALWAAQWLTDSAEQETPLPFFLACGIFRPHLPWVVPAEHFARFDLEKIQLPPIKDDDLSDTSVSKASRDYKYASKHNLLKEAAWAYLANIAYAGDYVGILLDALEKKPLSRQHHCRPMRRPRLASRRKTALPKIHSMGGNRLHALPHQSSRNGARALRSARQPLGPLPHARRARRAAEKRRFKQTQFRSHNRATRYRIELSCAHLKRRGQLQFEDRTLALYPLR